MTFRTFCPRPWRFRSGASQQGWQKPRQQGLESCMDSCLFLCIGRFHSLVTIGWQLEWIWQGWKVFFFPEIIWCQLTPTLGMAFIPSWWSHQLWPTWCVWSSGSWVHPGFKMEFGEQTWPCCLFQGIYSCFGQDTARDTFWIRLHLHWEPRRSDGTT